VIIVGITYYDVLPPEVCAQKQSERFPSKDYGHLTPPLFQCGRAFSFSSLIGKRQRHDVEGINILVFDQMRNAVGEYACFTRTGSRNIMHRPFVFNTASAAARFNVCK